MASSESPLPIRPRLRLLLSVLIIGHLLAVVLPPLAFQTRGPRGLSPSVGMLLGWVQRYSELLYLNRGYAFFAPDPGPSHLVRVERVKAADAVASEDPASAPEIDPIIFPRLSEQWPRLKYHRYFMLTEFLHDSYQPELPVETAALVGPDIPLEELRQWRLGRKRYDLIEQSMIRYWERRTGESPIELVRLEHQLPDFVGFVDRGLKINDPVGYVELLDEPIPLEALLDRGNETLPQRVEPVPAPEISEPAESLKTDAFLEPAGTP